MPRKSNNPFWSLSIELAEEYGNPHSDGMFRKHLGDLKKEGIDQDIAIATWRQLRSPEGLTDPSTGKTWSVPTAVLWTVTKGSPPYYQQYIDGMLKLMPPVYLAAAHDSYVMKYAKLLRKLGFRYAGWSCPEDAAEEGGSRLGYKLVQSLGLGE